MKVLPVVYWYLDDTHTHTPVLKIEGIVMFLKYHYPCFGVRPILPTGGCILPNGL